MFGIFKKSQRPLLQILSYIFYVLSELWGWKKLSKTCKAGHFSLCSFNKLMCSDGYLHEHHRLEYHKSMTIEVKR